MDFLNFIILHLIFGVTLFSFLSFTVILFYKLVHKPSSLEYYKITNIWFDISIVIIYISFFIIFFYGLRLYHIGNNLDLKMILKYFKIILNILDNISFIIKIDIIICCILIIANFFILFSLIHKYCISRIFNLYLFLVHNPIERISNRIGWVKQIMQPYNHDLVSYYILKIALSLDRKIFYYRNNFPWNVEKNLLSDICQEAWNLYFIDLKKRPWYDFSTLLNRILENRYYLNVFIPFTPVFFIVYDCIFNNFVLTHVYYYLLLYVPLMLWRRLTISLSTENETIVSLIWDILYKHETCIYALPTNHKKLFDVYIANGIRSVFIPGVAEMDLHVSMYIEANCNFEYYADDDCYKNSENVEIRDFVDYIATNNNIKILRWEDQEEIYEDWVVICIKK